MILGDFNNDGFPDFLIITTGVKFTVRILQSIPSNNTKHARFFKLVSDGMSEFESSGKPIDAVFMDLDYDVQKLLLRVH